MIDGAKYSGASWSGRSDGFYYTWIPPVDPQIATADRPGYQEVRFHKLGTDPKKDVTVHEKTGDPKKFIYAGTAKGGRWLIAEVQHGWTRTDLYFQDLRDAKPAWKPLVVGTDAIYDLEEYKDRFYVRTNEGASGWRVFKVDPLHPSGTSGSRSCPSGRVRPWSSTPSSAESWPSDT